MTKLTKIVLTVPSIIGILYLITFFTTDFLAWITTNIIEFKYQAPILNGIILIQLAYLIYRLWNYKNIDKHHKTSWTALLVVFNCVTSIIFIWKKDDEFKRLN